MCISNRERERERKVGGKCLVCVAQSSANLAVRRTCVDNRSAGFSKEEGPPTKVIYLVVFSASDPIDPHLFYSDIIHLKFYY